MNDKFSEATDANFYAVVCKFDSLNGSYVDVGIIEAESASDMATKLATEADNDGETRVFVFEGSRWRISTGRFKYLLDPNGGPPVPIFHQPAELEPDPNDYLTR